MAAPDQEEPQFSQGSHLEVRPARDRVENAFKTFDLDQDGFLTWQEFKQVSHFSPDDVAPESGAVSRPSLSVNARTNPVTYLYEN